MIRSSLAMKVALTATMVAVAAGVAGVGSYASFTSSTSAAQTVASGTVTIALGATGAATNRLTVGASGIAPGDTMQRSFDLNVDAASMDLASIALTTTASPTSLLDTDATNGLQMAIDKCSVAWTESGVAPAYTYTCGGTTSVVLASRAVIGSAISLSNLALTPSSSNRLRLTLTLPAAAGNTFQGLSSTVTYAFTGTQRAATGK